MFKKSKPNIIFDFYTSNEGKHILHLSELFLDDMYQKMKDKEITNFTRDYASYTAEYEFLLRFTGMTPSTYSFHVYDRRKKERLLLICYLSGSRCFSVERDYAKAIEGNKIHILSIHTLSCFDSLLQKVKRIDSARIEDVHIFSSSTYSQPVSFASKTQEEKPLLSSVLPPPLQAEWVRIQELVEKAIPVLTQTGDTESLYQMEKLAKEDLPQLVNVYLQLDEKGQHEEEADMMKQFKKTYDILSILYDKHAVSSFEKQLHIFKERYKDDSF